MFDLERNAILKLLCGEQTIVGRKILSQHWIGFELMDQDFLDSVENADESLINSLLEGWYVANKQRVADELKGRMGGYSMDAQSVTAMTQAVACFEQGLYIACVRTLLPEIERFARTLVQAVNGRRPSNQKEAIELLKQYVDSTPISKAYALEVQCIDALVADVLYETCMSEAQASLLPPTVNRHADAHGLRFYDDLRSAVAVLVIHDFLMRIGPTSHPMVVMSGTDQKPKVDLLRWFLGLCKDVHKVFNRHMKILKG